jgi:hypothetical protein
MDRDSESRPARAGRGRSRSRGRFPNRGKSRGDTATGRVLTRPSSTTSLIPSCTSLLQRTGLSPIKPTYATIKEAIITEINKTFEKGALDVVHALEKEEIEDLESLRPTLR